MTHSEQSKFETVDHTADVGIEVYGSDLSELFKNAALGLTWLMVERGNLGQAETREVRLQQIDLDSLLYDWLSEFIYLFDGEHLILSGFESAEVSTGADGISIAAVAVMCKFVAGSDAVKTYVKAPTYHQLKIERTDSGYTAQLVVDI